MRRIRLKPDPMGDHRNPFQIYILFIAALTGLSVVLRLPTTVGSLVKFLDHPYLDLWGALTLFGGAGGLLGMFWPWDVRIGLVIKRAAFMALSVPAAIYGAAVYHVLGWHSLTACLSAVGLGFASGVRAWKVHKHIKQVIDLSADKRGE